MTYLESLLGFDNVGSIRRGLDHFFHDPASTPDDLATFHDPLPPDHALQVSDGVVGGAGYRRVESQPRPEVRVPEDGVRADVHLAPERVDRSVEGRHDLGLVDGEVDLGGEHRRGQQAEVGLLHGLEDDPDVARNAREYEHVLGANHRERDVSSRRRWDLDVEHARHPWDAGHLAYEALVGAPLYRVDPRPKFQHVLVGDEGGVEGGSDALVSDIVVGGADPSRRNHHVVIFRELGDFPRNFMDDIWDHRDPSEFDAELVELARDEVEVLLGYLALQHLVPDDHHTRRLLRRHTRH